MTQISADLNNATVDGRIRVSLKRVDAPIKVEDEVTLIDSSDPDTRYRAAVVEINEAERRARLQVLKPVAGLVLTPELWGSPAFKDNSALSSAGLAVARLATSDFVAATG